jgi:hypothetical protein
LVVLNIVQRYILYGLSARWASLPHCFAGLLELPYAFANTSADLFVGAAILDVVALSSLFLES